MSVISTLRGIASAISAQNISAGDIVEFIDASPSPYGRIPRTLTLGKEYSVSDVENCVIEVQNDRGEFISFYANRFKKK